MKMFDRAAYCKGASALQALRAKMAELAGVADDRKKSLDLFLKLGRVIFQEYRFRLLGSDDLPGFLKKELPSLLSGVAQADIDKAVDEWQTQWLPN